MNKILLILISLIPSISFAASSTENLDLTSHMAGYIALIIFVLAYIFVMLEEFTHLRKSKPVILAAGIIWAIIGWVYATNGIPHAAEVAVRHNFLEFAELFLFLLVAMTYIESMRERLVFDKLKVWLISRGFSYRQLFWLTGFIALLFFKMAVVSGPNGEILGLTQLGNTLYNSGFGLSEPLFHLAIILSFYFVLNFFNCFSSSVF